MKKTWEAPQMKVHGNVEEITKRFPKASKINGPGDDWSIVTFTPSL